LKFLLGSCGGGTAIENGLVILLNDLGGEVLVSMEWPLRLKILKE
jgi:hypothetical protein